MPQDDEDLDDDDDAFESMPDPVVARLLLERDRSSTRRGRAGTLYHLVEGRRSRSRVRCAASAGAADRATVDPATPSALEHHDPMRTKRPIPSMH